MRGQVEQQVTASPLLPELPRALVAVSVHTTSPFGQPMTDLLRRPGLHQGPCRAHHAQLLGAHVVWAESECAKTVLLANADKFWQNIHDRSTMRERLHSNMAAEPVRLVRVERLQGWHEEHGTAC
jgi:hypothetical protein